MFHPYKNKRRTISIMLDNKQIIYICNGIDIRDDKVNNEADHPTNTGTQYCRCVL